MECLGHWKGTVASNKAGTPTKGGKDELGKCGGRKKSPREDIVKLHLLQITKGRKTGRKAGRHEGASGENAGPSYRLLGTRKNFGRQVIPWRGEGA